MRFRAGHAGPRAGLRSGDVGRRHATPQWSPRPTDLESRPTPSTNEAAVVDVQVLDQAAVDRVNASRVLGYRHSDDRLLEPPRWAEDLAGGRLLLERLGQRRTKSLVFLME